MFLIFKNIIIKFIIILFIYISFIINCFKKIYRLYNKKYFLLY